MKIYTSYFAQMRNFPPNMICFSTAHWEPRYITPGRSQNGIIWMGIPPLKPGPECDGLCNGKCAVKQPKTCDFLRTYRAQLDKLNFREIVGKIESIARKIQKEEGLKDVNAALLFYEKFDNPCSERIPIQQWFKDNRMEIEEWHK